MRQLHDRENGDRWILRGDDPTRHGAERAHDDEHGVWQGEPRRQRKQHDLGKHAERPQPRYGEPAQARLLPDNGRENVIGGVAALDQRRCQDDGEEARVTEQRARAARHHVSLFETVDRPEPETRQCAEPGHRSDHPNEVASRDHIDQ